MITGGTSGIGRAAAEIFAERDYRIATCGRDSERLADLRSSLSGDPLHHHLAQADLSDVRQTCQFAETAISRLGRVDVLINNAASAPLAPFDGIDAATFEQNLNINIRSTFYLTQIVWRQMKGQGRGAIVNISSMSAIDPFPGFSVYGASKAWLDSMTVALAREGDPHGIRVYSIRAGAVETPLLRRLFPDFPPEQCVSPDVVAAQIWACVHEPQKFESGHHCLITNQT